MASVRAELPLSPGSVIADRYRVEECLGVGGMGAVYRAFDDIVGEEVALKVLFAADTVAIDRFKRELKLARKVTHKNIARTFDIGRDAGRLFLTMELIVGETLRQRLVRQGPFPREEAAFVLEHVATGLAAAHEASVVHRDLKPSNVIVAARERVVVIDFGVAGAVGVGDREVVGTQAYMAPEQLRGDAPRPSTDVYAMGIVGYELLTGTRPFSGVDAHSARARLAAAPDLSALGEGDPMLAILKACLQLDPAARPPAGDLIGRFRALHDTPTMLVPTIEDEAATVVAPPTGTHERHGRTLVVLPFSVDGEQASKEFGAALADELSDVLAMTRGLQVVTPAAVPSGAELTTLAERLGVDVVVGGSVRRGADGGVRVRARLTDARAGTQLWSGQFDGDVGGILEIAAQVAMRIAEALRLELEAHHARGHVSDEAAELYLIGRRLMKSPVSPPREAVATFDRCLAIQPDFPLAVAARAVACARAYFLSSASTVNTREAAAEALAHAHQVAGACVDTTLAAGLFAVYDGKYREGLRFLRRTLELAPTHALAHDAIGRLECEAGHAARGMDRLALGLSLDPTLRGSLCVVARTHALRGRLDEFDRIMARVSAGASTPLVEEIMLETRVALWYSDSDRARQILDRIPSQGGLTPQGFPLAALFCRTLLGEDTERPLLAMREASLAMSLAPKFRCNIHQVAVELTSRSDSELALSHLEELGELPFIDVEWIELCPGLAPLRDSPRFESARKKVRARASSVWTQDAPSSSDLSR